MKLRIVAIAFLLSLAFLRVPASADLVTYNLSGTTQATFFPTSSPRFTDNVNYSINFSIDDSAIDYFGQPYETGIGGSIGGQARVTLTDFSPTNTVFLDNALSTNVNGLFWQNYSSQVISLIDPTPSAPGNAPNFYVGVAIGGT
tara:strand:- start:402 stop:833 length:432 start_codon:yes stop_codon:yes gene_type:complete